MATTSKNKNQAQSSKATPPKKSPFLIEEEPMPTASRRYEHLKDYLLADLKKLPIGGNTCVTIPATVIPTHGAVSTFANAIIKKYLHTDKLYKEYAIRIRAIKDDHKKIVCFRIWRIV